MIKSTEDIIYNRLKNSVGFHRSKKHLDWVRQFGEPHHLFGSYMGKKTSDYCTIPINNRDEHNEAEKDKSNYAIEHLSTLILCLIKRIEYLENNKG